MPKRKTTVLIADDDLQLLNLVTLNLELEGYDVLLDSDGRQALERIERHNPDLVLLDVMMPRMSGFAVCHRVRACSTVPNIIITARGQEQDKIRGLDLGADDYSSSLSAWANCWLACGWCSGEHSLQQANLLLPGNRP
jgi:two-component system, OmpR family, response regulator VicR